MSLKSKDPDDYETPLFNLKRGDLTEFADMGTIPDKTLENKIEANQKKSSIMIKPIAPREGESEVRVPFPITSQEGKALWREVSFDAAQYARKGYKINEPRLLSPSPEDGKWIKEQLKEGLVEASDHLCFEVFTLDWYSTMAWMSVMFDTESKIQIITDWPKNEEPLVLSCRLSHAPYSAVNNRLDNPGIRIWNLYFDFKISKENLAKFLAYLHAEAVQLAREAKERGGILLSDYEKAIIVMHA